MRTVISTAMILGLVGCVSTGGPGAGGGTAADEGPDAGPDEDASVVADEGAPAPEPDVVIPAPDPDPGPEPDPEPEPEPEPDPGPTWPAEWGPESCPEPPAGVKKGYAIGDQLAEVELQDCEGNDVFLSDFCGSSALWIFAAHGW